MESRLGAEQLETRKVLASLATLAPYASAPSGVTGSGVNSAEELAGFTIRVPFGTSGAVAGDILSLASGTTTLGTVELQAADITNTWYDFPIVTGQLGADGTKSVTAEITGGFVSPALTFLLDTTKPTVTVASSTPSLGIGQTAIITFTLSEASASFMSEDFSGGTPNVAATGGTLGNFVQVSPTVYTAVFTPTDNSTVPGSVSVAGFTFADAAVNFNVAGGLAVPITIDTVAPAVTSIVATPSSIGGSQPAIITFTLSKPSITFTASDVLVAGGTLSGFTGSGASYWALFTPAANSTTVGTISIPAGVFTDAVGNTNTASSTTTITVNTVVPTVTVTSDKTSIGGSQTATITFTLSEASTNFTASDVTTANGRLSAFAVTGDPLVYTATFTPDADFTGAATVTVNAGVFTDAAGNQNSAGATSIAVNTLAPTVTITSSTPTLGGTATALITFTLSAPSTNFTVDDVTVGGGSLSGFSGSGSVYTAIFTPTPSSTAPGTVSVAANSFTDAAGNQNLPGSLASAIIIDEIPPTVVVTSSVPSVNGTQTATITITLSEGSTNFLLGDIAVSGGSLGSFIAVSPTVYTVVFTPFTNSTTNGTVSIPAGVFTDAAGNPNTASAVTTITVDTVAPGVFVTSDVPSVNGTQTATITFTLSEASTNFTASDVTTTNGRLSAFAVTGDPLVYTATFTPDADFTGAATVTVNAGVFTDAEGNQNSAGATSIAVNTLAPTVTITSSTPTLAIGQTAVITFTLSAASTTFVLGDATATGGTLGSFTAVSSTVYTAVFTPATTSTAPGTVSIAAAAFTDSAGNDNLPAALPTAITIDTMPPVVTILATPAAVGGGNTSIITFTLSKPSTTFTASDVLVTGGTLSGFTGAGVTYSATFTPRANSIIPGNVSVPAAAFTDAIGNANTASSITAITVDTLAPAQPVITTVISNLPLAAGLVPAGGTTNDQTLQLTGTAEPASTVNVFINGTQVATATADSAGAWTHTTTTLAVASYSFSVTATDASLNTSVSSAPAYTVTIDVTSPAITSVSVPTGIYRTGSIVPFTVTFSEPVLVTTAVPELSILVGTGRAAVPRVATLNPVPVSTTNTLVFTYTVDAADTNDVDGINLSGINLNGGLIFDAAGNAANLGLPVLTINNDVFLMPQQVGVIGFDLQTNSADPSGTGFTADPRATPVSYFTITFSVPVPIFNSNATLDGVLDLSDFASFPTSKEIINALSSPTLPALPKRWAPTYLPSPISRFHPRRTLRGSKPFRPRVSSPPLWLWHLARVDCVTNRSIPLPSRLVKSH
jgi:hypothetical protein